MAARHQGSTALAESGPGDAEAVATGSLDPALGSDPPGVFESEGLAKTAADPFPAEVWHNCRTYLLLIANQELDAELRSQGAPSDLVQQTLLQARQHLGRFRGSSARELRAWLRRILWNELRSWRRRSRRRCAAEDYQSEASAVPAPAEPIDSRWWSHLPGEEPTPSRVAVADESQRRLVRALAALPEVYRQVVWLRYWQRLSFDEIGQAIERSGEAARKLWFRAVEELKAELEQPDDLRPSRSPAS